MTEIMNVFLEFWINLGIGPSDRREKKPRRQNLRNLFRRKQASDNVRVQRAQILPGSWLRLRTAG